LSNLEKHQIGYGKNHSTFFMKGTPEFPKPKGMVGQDDCY